MRTDTITDAKNRGRLRLLFLCLLLVVWGSLYLSGCATTLGGGDQSDSSAAEKRESSEAARKSAAQAASALESRKEGPVRENDSSPESFEPPVATGPAPQWVKSRPSEAGFFYGIGRAERDVEKEDTMAEARSRALADLASQLSAEVEERIRIEQSESSDGERFSFVRMESDSTVDLRLPELDEVKSYRADDGTSWYLVGLSYNTWLNWLHPEQESARQKVIDTVRYSARASYGERLQKIRNALTILEEEPFGDKMQGSLWGKQGNMESILGNRYASILGELELEGLPEEAAVSDKDVPTIEGKIVPERDISVGPMYVHIVDEEGNLAAVAPTAPDGSFSARLSGVPAKGGSYGYKAVAKPFGAAAAALSAGALIPFPSFPFTVHVEESFVQLRVISNWSGAELEKVRNYLQQQLDVPIRPEESDAILTVELSFRESEEGFGDVAISFLRGTVKYRDETKEAVLWRSGEIRGYGTAREYARRKAIELFIEQLEENIHEIRSVEAMF